MARLSMSAPAPWHLGRPGRFDMACDILTSLCGTIGPLSICQLINFNFAVLPHLRTVHAARRLPGECARKLSVPLPIAGTQQAPFPLPFPRVSFLA